MIKVKSLRHKQKESGSQSQLIIHSLYLVLVPKSIQHLPIIHPQSFSVLRLLQKTASALQGRILSRLCTILTLFSNPRLWHVDKKRELTI